MCGRLRLTYKISELIEAMKDLKIAGDIRMDPNCAPTDSALIIAADPNGIPKSRQAVFGLIPNDAQDRDISARLCNARIETAHQKPSFAAAYAKRHCIIPCSGFYEWRAENGRKQPYLFSRQDQGTMFLAGLWERWIDPREQAVYSFTILTQPAIPPIADYHHRSPLILKDGRQSEWLDRRVRNIQDLRETGEALTVAPAPIEMNRPTFKNF